MTDLNFITVYMTAWNSHDTEQVVSLYTSDFEGTDVAEARPLRGLDDVRRMVKRFMVAFPDLNLVVQDVVFDTQAIVLSWKMRGTHDGPFMNIPASGRSVEITGISMFGLKDGRIERGQQVWDLAGLLRSIGLLPRL